MTVEAVVPTAVVRVSSPVAYAGVSNRVIMAVPTVTVATQFGFAGVPVYADPFTAVVEVSAGPFTAGAFAPIPDAMQYLHANLGPAETITSDALQYLHANLGPIDTIKPIAVQYLYANVSLFLVAGRDGGQYLYLEVTDEDPHPHLWWLQPEVGSVGDAVRLVGNGFGATQATFDGQVYLNDELCTVVSWVLVPASAGDPFIDEAGKETNVEHVRIIVAVPAEGESGNMLVETEIVE